MKQLTNPQRYALEAVAAQPQGSFIIGVDEVGYGCIAGPVFVGAAVVRAGWKDPRVRDSKQLDHQQRQRAIRDALVPPNLAFSVILGHTSQDIDKMGVHHARDDLVKQVVLRCRALYPHALVVMDGNELPFKLDNMVCLPKADVLVTAVSAASILAKEDRDACMKELHQLWPMYGFSNHKGYGTGQHNSALARYGPCPIHRFSYRNIQEVAAKFGDKAGSSPKPSQKKSQPARISGWRPLPSGMRVSTNSNKR
jgi:ribonuclease HII